MKRILAHRCLIIILFLGCCSSLYATVSVTSIGFYIAPDAILTGTEHFQISKTQVDEPEIDFTERSNLSTIYVTEHTLFFAPDSIMEQVVCIQQAPKVSVTTSKTVKLKTRIPVEAVVNPTELTTASFRKNTPIPFREIPHQKHPIKIVATPIVFISHVDKSSCYCFPTQIEPFGSLSTIKLKKKHTFQWVSSSNLLYFPQAYNTRPPPSPSFPNPTEAGV